MKKLILPLLAILIIVVSALALLWWNNNLKPVSSNDVSVRFVIPKGYGATQIANKLYEQKLIRNPLVFKIYVQVKGISGKIKAGEYDLKQNSTLSDQILTFLKGPTSIWVTIPEGLRREEIAIRFAEGLSKQGQERELFISEFLENSEGKEGYLFPDTYLFPKDTTGIKVANYLLDTFNKKTSEFKADIEKSSLSLNELITIASLIEREAKGLEERPVIAGILLNRLDADWPLQVDAAVQYAVASTNCQKLVVECSDWWPVLTKDNLEINSPFNTYKYTGLPPSPISNPGLSSIKAAVYPQDTPNWFYLHDNQGKIHYAVTIEEHNQNIRKFLGK